MSKINTAALQQYSQSYSAQVCDDFFKNNATASGQQIHKLTDVPQVNMFVISGIFEKWKADAQNFRSPYFNFESDSVKTAMQTFMNVVSQQIAVKREHLEPLLTEATKSTMSLLIDPKDYFNTIFRDQPNFMLTSNFVSQLQKYTKFHAVIPQHITAKMAGQDFVYVNQAIIWLDEAIAKANEKPEDVNYWISIFSEKKPLNIDLIVKKTAQESTAKTEIAVSNNEQSFFDSATDNVAEPIPQNTGPKLPKNETAQISQIQTEVSPEETLNDSLRPEQENLAEQLQNQAISSIPENIPLHQKFMFTAQLFGGSMIAYEKMIAELEQASNYQSARDLVTYNYTSQYGWDASSDAVSQLIEVLKRRFV